MAGVNRKSIVLLLVFALSVVTLPLLIVEPQAAHAGPYSVFVQSAINTCYSSNSCLLNFPHHIAVGDFVVIAWSGIWVECLGTLCSFAQPSATTTSVGSYASSFEADIGKLPSVWGTLAQLPNGTYVNTLMAGDIGSFNVTTVGMSNSIFTSGLTVSVTSGETMNSTTVVGYEVHLPLSFTTYSTLSAWWQRGGPYTAGSVNPLTEGNEPCDCTFSTPMILPPASSVPGATNNTAWIGISRWTAPGTLSGNDTFFKQSDGANYIAQNTTLITPSPSTISPFTGPNAFVADITELQSDTTPSGFGVGIGFFVDPIPSVVQPAECTMENSGTPIANLSVSVSLGFVSPDYLYCDGSTHHFSLLPSTTMTISTPADGANTRYRYPGGNTTRTISVCSTGTCEQANTSIYLELRNDWKITAEAEPAFGSGLSVAFIGTIAGVGSLTVCSMSPITLTNIDFCSGWSDYNEAVIAPHFLTGSYWQNAAGAATTITPVTGGNTENIDYYRQVSATFQFRSAQFWTGTSTQKITGTYLGSTATICTASTSYGTGGWYNSAGGGTITSCSGYVDYNGIATYPSTFTLNSTKFVSIFACQSSGCPLNAENYTSRITYTSNLTMTGFPIHTTFAVWYVIDQPSSGSVIWTQSCTGTAVVIHGGTSTKTCSVSGVTPGEIVTIQGVLASNLTIPFTEGIVVSCIGSSQIVPTGASSCSSNGVIQSTMLACAQTTYLQNVNLGFPISSSGSLTLTFKIENCYGTGHGNYQYTFTVSAISGYSPISVVNECPYSMVFYANSQACTIYGNFGGAGYTSPGIVVSGFFAANDAFVSANSLTNSSAFTATRNSVLPSGNSVSALTDYYGVTAYSLSYVDPATLMSFTPSSAFVGYSLLVYDGGPDAMSSDVAVCVDYKLIGGGSFNGPPLSYVDNGTAKKITLTNVPQCITASTYTIPGLLTGISASDSERGLLVNSTSGTFSVPATYSFVYWHQLNIPVSYTITDAIATNHPTFTYQYLGASVVIMNSKFATPYWIDYNSYWTAQSPFTTSPDFITLPGHPPSGQAANLQGIVIAYYASSTCASPDPLLEIYGGCIIPAIVDAWSYGIGVAPWMGFVLLGVNVAIYNKNQNVWLSLTILWVTGAVFGVLLPPYVGQIAQIFLALGAAGLVVKAVLAAR